MLKAFTTMAGIAVLAGASTVASAQGKGWRGGDAQDLGEPGAKAHAVHSGGGGGGGQGWRGAAALEGVGADIATACIEAMGAARKSAHEAIRTSAQDGVNAVRTLNENEAPDEAIELAGKQAAQAIGAAAIAGDLEVSTLALECVQTLQTNGADQRVILAVLRAREANQRAVLQGGMRGGMALRRAVGVATGKIDLEAPRGDRHRGPHGRHGRRGPGGPHGPDRPVDEDAGGADEM